MILVTGATGRVGRPVLSQLLDRGVAVRALTRDPDTADLPAGVDAVRAVLSDPAMVEQHLDGVEGVFLVWPFASDKSAVEMGPGVVEAITRQSRRIVYLSAEAVRDRPNSFWATLERLIERSDSEWTFLRPTGFAANTMMWAEQIRGSGVVRWPFGDAARSPIHERDIASVAVRALTEAGHVGAVRPDRAGDDHAG
jgi:uncharacterized protein YbjT (DUF2867 family)